MSALQFEPQLDVRLFLQKVIRVRGRRTEIADFVCGRRARTRGGSPEIPGCNDADVVVVLHAATIRGPVEVVSSHPGFAREVERDAFIAVADHVIVFDPMVRSARHPDPGERVGVADVMGNDMPGSADQDTAADWQWVTCGPQSRVGTDVVAVGNLGGGSPLLRPGPKWLE